MALGDILGGITSQTGTVLWGIGLIIVVGGTALLLIFGGFLWWWFKKRWNLKVEFKLTRSDGRLTTAEWGKGYFNAKRGVCFVKRPGLRQRAIPIKIFDIRRYVQGDNVITVIQVGSEDFRPVLNESWQEHSVEYVDDETGETKVVKETILNIKVDTGLNKAWKTAFESAAKKAYSLTTFFQQFQVPIAIAIVVISLFVGFAIIWTRLPTVCGG